MRHGIVAAACAAFALSGASWVLAAPVVESVDAVAAPPPVSDGGAEVADTSLAGPTAPPDHPVVDAVPPAPQPVAIVGDDGGAFLDALNSLRADDGLATLTRRPSLDALAQGWAETMAADDHLRHSELIYDVIEGSWTRAGENVGYGPTPAAIARGFADSPGHRANIVDPTYDSVGIGTVRVDGVLWTAHLFAG